LRGFGHTVLDLGADNATRDDYPDYSEACGLAVLETVLIEAS